MAEEKRWQLLLHDRLYNFPTAPLYSCTIFPDLFHHSINQVGQPQPCSSHAFSRLFFWLSQRLPSRTPKSLTTPLPSPKSPTPTFPKLILGPSAAVKSGSATAVPRRSMDRRSVSLSRMTSSSSNLDGHVNVNYSGKKCYLLLSV